jgi:hypothetical protein
MINERAFSHRAALESVFLGENSALLWIGLKAFSDRSALRSEKIGCSCFELCTYLYQLRFESARMNDDDSLQ